MRTAVVFVAWAAFMLAVLLWPGGALPEGELPTEKAPRRHIGSPSESAPYWVAEFRRRYLVEKRANRQRATTIRRLKRVLAVRHHPVDYALRLASAAYSVPLWELRAVASCESGQRALAQNGIYRGVFQTGPMFERGPFGSAGFSVWDPVPNALTAAYTVAREGWSQWECRP